MPLLSIVNNKYAENINTRCFLVDVGMVGTGSGDAGKELTISAAYMLFFFTGPIAFSYPLITPLKQHAAP